MKSLVRKLIPLFLLNWYHFSLPFLGAIFYRFPSRQRPASPAKRGERGSPEGAAGKLVIIGVTGTNGKSTVVNLATKILKEAGYKVASLSSIEFKTGDQEWSNTLKMTMPGRFKMQKFLRQAVNAGCKYAVLEVTSEGIKQHRHRFINFNVVVFTNLTPEHIEAHGGFEKYRRAKGKLFQATKNTHILNLDDENVEYFLKFPANKKYGFRIRNQESGIRDEFMKNVRVIKAQEIKFKENYSSFMIHNSLFNIPLLGEFNIYNALAAICVGLSQGIDLATCKRALEKVEGIPGRMEVVIRKPFKVIVDYAHTPDALEKVYQTIHETCNMKHETKTICVLGAAGGGRDKWKRPELGKIATKYCDQIILTNEDPYSEPPEKILEEIASGIKTYNLKPKTYNLILDRREAIRKALILAKPFDVVIITGKGCESWMCLEGGKKIPWDDRKIVKEEFLVLNKQ